MSEKLRATDGTRWAFMQRYDICDLNDPTDLYLRRWRVIQTPYGGLYLHRIERPDGDRYLHDHPWRFVSVILRGGYCEDVKDNRMLPSVRRWHRAGTVNVMRRGQFHAIRRLLRTPTWTLVLVGRRRSDWGYLTPAGWVDHETQHAEWGV